MEKEFYVLRKLRTPINLVSLTRSVGVKFRLTKKDARTLIYEMIKTGKLRFEIKENSVWVGKCLSHYNLGELLEFCEANEI